MKIFLENIKKPLTIKPYVVRDLAHHINLGQSCLRRHNAKLTFEQEGGCLEIRGEITKLKHRSQSLIASTVDS